MARMVCLCVDGSAGRGRIGDAVRGACAACGVSLGGGAYRYSKSAAVSVAALRRKIADLAAANGGDPGALRLLLVGKSLGAAKLYRLAHDHAAALFGFERAAIVLVDAHEPGEPGDGGATGRWYDYVRFAGGGHNLAWQEDAWGPPSAQAFPDARLAFHAIHQRNEWPRGYSFRAAHADENLTRKRVVAYPSKERELADHDNIEWCDRTVDAIAAAIRRLEG